MRLGVARHLFALAGTLAIGPFFAQGLLLACSPVLTRLFDPREFAAIAVFLLVGTAIASLSCLKLDNAIIRARSSRLAAHLAALALSATLLSAIASIAIGAMIAEYLGSPREWEYAALLSAYILFGGCYDVFNALALRRGLARIVTKGRIVLAVSALVIQIGLGLVSGSAEVFVLGLAAGYLCTIAYLWVALRLRIHRKMDWSGAPALLYRHRQDWLYGGPAALFLTLQNNLPAVVLAAVVGPTIGGFYALIQRVVFNPVIIVTAILGQSVLPWLSMNRNEGAIKLLARFCGLLAMAMLGFVMLAYPWFECVFSFVFGPEWRGAGVYGGLLLLLLPFRMVFDVISVASVAENRQSALFLARVLALVSGLAVLVSFRESDAWSGFFLFSLTQAVCAVLGVVVVALSLALRMQRLLVLLVLGVTGIYELVYVVENQVASPWRLIADGFFFGTGFLLVSASVGLMVVARRQSRALPRED